VITATASAVHDVLVLLVFSTVTATASHLRARRAIAARRVVVVVFTQRKIERVAVARMRIDGTALVVGLTRFIGWDIPSERRRSGESSMSWRIRFGCAESGWLACEESVRTYGLPVTHSGYIPCHAQRDHDLVWNPDA
jgi:hypothetical protein